MHEKITTRTVARALTEAKSTGAGVYVWDSQMRGFGLRASPTGRVSVFVEKWTGGRGGRGKRVVIGSMPPWDLETAKTEAASKLGDIAKGADLVDRKTQARLAKRKQLQTPTLSDAVDKYLERNRKPGTHWGEVERMFDRDVKPVIGANTLVTQVTRDDIKKLLEFKFDKGQQGAARYLYAVLRPFFKWSVGEDYIAQSPMENVPMPKALKARDRKLSPDEIKAFWKATGRMHQLWRAFYRLLLLTAQRREEVAGMNWDELPNKGDNIWIIPKERTKNKTEHTVHLNDMAIYEILETLDKGPHPFVFTTTGTTSISGFGKPKARLDKLMAKELGGELKPWRVHDLRRTAASGMAQLGFPPHIVERVLNHTSGAQGGLVGVYQQYEYLPEREACIRAWGQYVENLIPESAR